METTSVKRYLAEVEECLDRIDTFEAIIASAKVSMEAERDHVNYLAGLMVADAIENVRTSYRTEAEEDLISTVWFLYWRLPKVKVPVIETAIESFAGKILMQTIMKRVKDRATVEVACSRCRQVSNVKVTSRTALKEANSRNGWRKPLCDSCKEIEKQEEQERSRRWELERTQRTARLQELQSMPYREYLQTEEWQEARAGALKRAKYSCQLCNSKDNLNVHHRTYERRGHELASDLIVLCQQCHKTFHGIED